MNWHTRWQLLLQIEARDLLVAFIQAFGVLWLLLEPLSLLLGPGMRWGWSGYLGLLLVSALWALLVKRPRRVVRRRLADSDAIIEVRLGDLFDQPGHLAMGVNNAFDTDPQIAKGGAVQSQLVRRCYEGDLARLDAALDVALADLPPIGKLASHKELGRITRYPIGTTIALGEPDARQFLVAVARIADNLHTTSDADCVWDAFTGLWEACKVQAHSDGVSLPIIGSDAAQTCLARMVLIKLTVLSFVIAKRRGLGVSRLTIMVHPKDLEHVNMVALREFLDSV